MFPKVATAFLYFKSHRDNRNLDAQFCLFLIYSAFVLVIFRSNDYNDYVDGCFSSHFRWVFKKKIVKWFLFLFLFHIILGLFWLTNFPRFMFCLCILISSHFTKFISMYLFDSGDLSLCPFGLLFCFFPLALLNGWHFFRIFLLASCSASTAMTRDK